MTDWETTKIKGDVKAEAAELDATYTEVMRAGVQALKRAPDTPVNEADEPLGAGVDTDELAAEIVDIIGAEAGGSQVDDSEIAREVARQLDYAALSNQVADEVVGRLR
jgi:hypothetical protein